MHTWAMQKKCNQFGKNYLNTPKNLLTSPLDRKPVEKPIINSFINEHISKPSIRISFRGIEESFSFNFNFNLNCHPELAEESTPYRHPGLDPGSHE